MTTTMSGAKNTKFAKQSARANSIEKRRMEQEIRSIDNSKRAMAVDMRKSQGEYKRRLLNFKNRQKELMMNKSGASMTESSMGEYLLQSLISRQSSSPRRRNQKSAGRTSEDIESWQKDVPKHGESQDSHTSREDTPSPFKAGNNGPADTRLLKGREKQISPTSTATPYYCAKTESTKNNSSTTSIKEHSRPNSHSTTILKSRSSKVISDSLRPTTSGATVKIIEHNEAGHDHQLTRRPHTEPGPDTDVTKSLGNTREPSDTELMSTDSDTEFCPDEFGAEEELGRISNRQRSKLDLRPDTAWRIRNGITSTSSCRVSLDVIKNPFHGMKGHLGHPWKQVRYFDQDEIEERGMFYRLLVKDRLERERDKLEDIRVRINEFSNLTRTPLNSRPVANA